MSGNFHDANYNVTKIRTEDGDVVELELNNKNVPLGINIEDDKEIDFDVLDYKEPVELKPSEGMESMKKVTLTLDLPDVLKPQTFTNVRYRTTSAEWSTNGTVVFDQAPGSVPYVHGVLTEENENEIDFTINTITLITSGKFSVNGTTSDEEPHSIEIEMETQNYHYVIFEP